MAGTPSPGSGHLKIPLPHDPTDRPYDACLRPIFLRRGRSGPGPAEDRPAIFGRALLQRFGPTSRPQAQRKPLPDTERLQRHQHGSGPAYPEHLSVAEPELASRRGGDPEAPDRTSAEAASAEVLYLPLYPDLLSLDRDFRPGEDRRIPFPAAATRCRPVSCPAIACFSPGRRPSPSCSAELMSSLSGRPGCAGLSARTSRRSASGSFR